MKNAVFWNIKTHVRFEVFTAVTMKNGDLWDVTPCGLVRADVSGVPSTTLIMGKRIGEIGTTQVGTSNRRTLRRRR
jgi:hypothetical protein